MKKMIKTIALAATCALAGMGCQSLGAAENESYWSRGKKCADSFYESKNLAWLNLGLGTILAGIQLLDTENKNNQKHAAMTLALSTMPLLAELADYKIPSAIPVKPQPLSKLFTILGKTCGDNYDKSTKQLTPSIGKRIFNYFSTAASAYEWGSFAYNAYQNWTQPQTDQ